MNRFTKSIILGTAVIGMGVAPAMAATGKAKAHKAAPAKPAKAAKAKKAAAK